MTKHIAGFLTLATCFTFAGCGPSSRYTPSPPAAVEPTKVVPGTEESLFPLQPGDQWTYDFYENLNSDAPGNPSEIQVRVKDSHRVGSGTRATLELVEDGELKDRQTWQVDDYGLSQVTQGLKDTPFVPIQTIVKFPLKVGTEFDWSGEGIMPNGLQGHMDVHSIVRPSEAVDTNLQPTSAVPIESHIKFMDRNGPGECLSTIYLEPKIGMVRYRTVIKIGTRTITQLLRLKSHVLLNS